jgi:hypothetical protein
MEPGVARVAVAVNMYQTAAWCNLKNVAQPKTLRNENSYQTAQPKEQPARQDPNLNSKLNAKEN